MNTHFADRRRQYRDAAAELRHKAERRETVLIVLCVLCALAIVAMPLYVPAEDFFGGLSPR